MGKEKKEKKDKSEKKEKSKKEAKQLREEAEMMAVLQRCKSSMCQVFAEQTVVADLVEKDFMELFAESPEYAQALEAFKRRFDAENGRS